MNVWETISKCGHCDKVVTKENAIRENGWDFCSQHCADIGVDLPF